MTVVGSIGEALLGRTSRRGFLAKATVTAAALTVAPTEFLTKPGSAYGAVCQCAPGSNCDCSSKCCDGYTEFCCSINDGVNACPPGTFAGGWWKAAGSQYCAGARYYIDCMGDCNGCGCGGGHFCPSCDGFTCGCTNGNCNNWHVGCAEFRYGQCHPGIGCSGRIACRVVSCTPPWQLDSSCGRTTFVDNGTANHAASCQAGPTSYQRVMVGFAAKHDRSGYWLADGAGGVSNYGTAARLGHINTQILNQPQAGMAATPSGKGYWLVDWKGHVNHFGNAANYGSLSRPPKRPIVGIAANIAGNGFWLVDGAGGVHAFGRANHFGQVTKSNRHVVGIAAVPIGRGYWVVESDGYVHAFGTARTERKVGHTPITTPIVGISGTPTGKGYWLVERNGVVHTYGDARYYGGVKGAKRLMPTVAIVATATGKGYWVIARNGEVHHYGDALYHGGRVPD